ncbi:PEP-CTERM sorting domain-containing protein [Phormidesmis priestleyi ULC007]|uniref:PEP-CTERM sorting domain-containing protein n=1 Tax=Phormidesmis priestleyi ULC007 TaxID=1920490 RepID=A0A2T1DES9_9CYAN|nr:esterase-like activity of phytase family protein [Phormidesmis priestleyi]PSB19020.1 PEP-CTERM sorting domain-containing protein [Phormidesmis priestleyi ULC007]PZO54008.1 MAG: esterase-like activity of phytase family protein [Phormidesmis priestleyi]
MLRTKYWISLLSCSLLMSIAGNIHGVRSAQGASLVNNLVIPGESTDLAAGSGANANRLGGFFSDLYYDRYQNLYYGLVDRGPGGGTISYNTRVEKFSLDVDAKTGAIAGFKLLDTILLTNAGSNYNGLNPKLLNGDASKLGLSLDPEGFAIAPNGNFYIADEYGPSINEFSANGSLVRSFATPSNLLPKDATGLNFVAGRPTLISGRQDNRGFEGVTLSPDGSKLFALLQGPLVNEGGTPASPDGRRSRNLRLVEFDTKTGKNTGQYIYQLEDISTINDRIPGTADDFTATQQGRNIGISAITALNNSEFLVLERDNRGVGVDDPAGTNPIGSKRVYKISLNGATNVSDTSLAGTNALPVGINAVSKSLFLDIADALKASGQKIPEKLEGLAIGPQLTDGSYALLIGTDNDFSVTQNGSNVQFDVCTNGISIPLGSGCPAGSTLIPTYLYSFKASGAELKGFVPPAKVPEPASAIGLALIAVGAFGLKRKQTAQ